MAKRKTKSSPKRRTPAGAHGLPGLKYALPAVVLVIGQILFFRGSHAVGMVLSLAAILLLVAFLNGFSLNLKGFSLRLPAKKISWKMGAVIVGLLISFIWAAWGQYYLSRPEFGDTGLWKGLGFYAAAVAVFLASLWPWNQERLQREPLPPQVEWTAFGLIMVLALFFRLYRIKDIPAGIFIDEGFAGYAALKVLHEGWRFFYLPEPHQHPSLFIYLIALWFKIFSPTAVHFTLFSVFMGVISLPFIYWAYRQWAGPRVALVGLFILAVMRWNVNFTRNSQRTELMPFFMFAAISLFLYAYQQQKRWAFLASGFFLGAGLYTYQSYKIFPLLIIIYLAYELAVNRKKFKANLLNIGLAALMFLAWAAPLLNLMWQWKSMGPREASISMIAKCQQEHSLQPLLHNTWLTALMYNRVGDPNPRHNLSNHRMLDDVTGVLFVLGCFYALRHACRRKYFYALAGLGIMTLPCLLSTDAAHANRMMGTTPFTCFLAAVPIAAIWGRARKAFGLRGEVALVMALAVPLYFMASNNFHDYFVKQAGDFAVWAEFSTPETTIGKAINENGDSYEYYLSPRYYNHYTILFLGYFQQDHTHPMFFPESVLPASVPPGRGLLYALEEGRTGVLDELKSIYPEGKEEDVVGPNGQTVLYFYKVPAASVDARRGLNVEISEGKGPSRIPVFPSVLPPGPYHAVFTGSLYLEQAADYRFTSKSNGTVSWWIGGRLVALHSRFHLIKGFHPVKIVLDAPENPTLELSALLPDGRVLPLDSKRFSGIAPSHGLKAFFYNTFQPTGEPALVQWEPVINYVNGNDFPYHGGSAHWVGTLKVPQTGNYQFVTQTYDMAGLEIDHKKVIPLGPASGGLVHLTAGSHALDVYYTRPGNGWSNFTLLWLPPGGARMEVVPNSVFGEIE